MTMITISNQKNDVYLESIYINGKITFLWKYSLSPLQNNSLVTSQNYSGVPFTFQNILQRSVWGDHH